MRAMMEWIQMISFVATESIWWTSSPACTRDSQPFWDYCIDAVVSESERRVSMFIMNSHVSRPPQNDPDASVDAKDSGDQWRRCQRI